MEEVRMGDDQGVRGHALPREWESVVEDCSWPRARDVALSCYRHMGMGHPDDRRFSGLRSHFKDCTYVNLILRQKWLTAYIMGEERDWEAHFEEQYGACPEVGTWRDGVRLHARTQPEVTAIMRWVELW
jgi:hypothetical protein